MVYSLLYHIPGYPEAAPPNPLDFDENIRKYLKLIGVIVVEGFFVWRYLHKLTQLSYFSYMVSTYEITISRQREVTEKNRGHHFAQNGLFSI